MAWWRGQGQLLLTNSHSAPLAVYSIAVGVVAGPVAEVACGRPPPFQIPPCASVACSWRGFFPQPPSSGLLTASASVAYQLDGADTVSSAASTAVFQVDKAPAGHVVSSQNSDAPQVPDGQALVTDSLLPGQALRYAGTGQQSYALTLQCAAAGSSTLGNKALLLASTGQEVAASASLLQHCHELTVQLGDIAAPSIARLVAWRTFLHAA
ncbi:hypothetical protein OEZ86_001411 [Tetradesmus obliquus]|nr:hypothetical protein OEZ86_001411 [Tetradesmus obliquus]